MFGYILIVVYAKLMIYAHNYLVYKLIQAPLHLITVCVKIGDKCFNNVIFVYVIIVDLCL